MWILAANGTEEKNSDEERWNDNMQTKKHTESVRPTQSISDTRDISPKGCIAPVWVRLSEWKIPDTLTTSLTRTRMLITHIEKTHLIDASRVSAFLYTLCANLLCDVKNSWATIVHNRSIVGVHFNWVRFLFYVVDIVFATTMDWCSHMAKCENGAFSSTMSFVCLFNPWKLFCFEISAWHPLTRRSSMCPGEWSQSNTMDYDVMKLLYWAQV